MDVQLIPAIENRNYHIVDLFLLDAINFYTYGNFNLHLLIKKAHKEQDVLESEHKS